MLPLATDTTLDDDAGYAGGVLGVLHSGVEVADVGWDDNHGGCFASYSLRRAWLRRGLRRQWAYALAPLREVLPEALPSWLTEMLLVTLTGNFDGQLCRATLSATR